MHKRNRPPCLKIVLQLPDLDHAKSAVLNSLSSPHSRRSYKFAMEQFITWHCSEPRLALNRTVVLRFRLYLESLGLAAGTVNQRPYGSCACLGKASNRSTERLAKVAAGRIFRAVSRHGTPWGKGISENVIRYVVRRCAERMQLDHLSPHDLWRTCAKLCHVNGGELEQIQFLLRHVFVLTTERYLGCEQNLEEPVNDRFGCFFAPTSVGLR